MVFPEIAKLMACNRMTHKDIAAIIETSQQAATKKLNGESEFKLSEMNKLKAYFGKIVPGITMDKLFEFYCPCGSYMNQKNGKNDSEYGKEN